MSIDLSKLASNLKGAYPIVEHQIDNLVDLLYDDMEDGIHWRDAMKCFEDDLRASLLRYGYEIDEKQLRSLLN